MGRIHFAVVNRGKANAVKSIAEELGIKQATILNGEGTIRSKVLEPLGLNQTLKEIVLLPVSKDQDINLHNRLSEELEFEKRNKGISFSIPFTQWTKNSKTISFEEVEVTSNLIMVVVEKGHSNDVIKAARGAKARGGTVIHGRGGGTLQNFAIPLNVEPQKDTILIVVSKDKKDDVKTAIQAELDRIEDGIIFTLPVIQTSGLFEERIENKINKIKGGKD